MRKWGLSIIAFAVLGGSIAWFLTPRADTSVQPPQKQTPVSPSPVASRTRGIGLDREGLPAVCDEHGVAFNYLGGNIPTIEPRVKEGAQVTCMSKRDAEEFLLTIGSDRASIDKILNNYPVFTPKIN